MASALGLAVVWARSRWVCDLRRREPLRRAGLALSLAGRRGTRSARLRFAVAKLAAQPMAQQPMAVAKFAGLQCRWGRSVPMMWTKMMWKKLLRN